MSKILDGALSAMARQGLRKLSMSDVCEEAGIARGTLYRYFKSKDDVLEAIGHHVVMNLTVALEQAVSERPDLEVRVQVVMDSFLGFWDKHPELVQVGQLEPAFTLSYQRRVLPQFHAILRDTLAPVLEDSAAVRDGRATVDQLVDLMLRITVTHYFMPNEYAGSLPELMAGLVGTEKTSQRTSTRRGLAS